MSRYELVFDDGHREYITADSSTEAVANRDGGSLRRLPHTISDLTAIEAWKNRPQRESTPLLTALRGDWE